MADRKQQGTGKRLELSLEIDGEIPEVVGDPLRLRQVVQNLISNAIKFTDDGAVRLRLSTGEPGRVIIRVSDTGPGIGASELAQIFERYRQTGKLKSQRQGSGLGLGICHHLVALHGGEIRAESEIGRGSTFTVILPLEPPARTGGGQGAELPELLGQEQQDPRS